MCENVRMMMIIVKNGYRKFLLLMQDRRPAKPGQGLEIDITQKYWKIKFNWHIELLFVPNVFNHIDFIYKLQHNLTNYFEVFFTFFINISDRNQLDYVKVM